MNRFSNVLLLVLILVSILSSCKNEATTASELNFETPPDSLELLFPNTISTDLFERDFAMAPDRNEIIYTLGNQDQSRRVLVSIKKVNDTWSDKTIWPILGDYSDIEPFFSPKGDQLFFASNRPIYGDSTRTDYNIWVSSKVDNKWQSPIALDSVINTKGNEFYPAVTNSGNLYFTATKPEGFGLEDIFISEYKNNTYNSPIVLDATVNSKLYEFNAYVNPQEDLIIYTSYGRPDGHGGGDLYYSKKDSNGSWSEAKNLGMPINSEKLDFCPFYDSKANVLYFSSLRVEYPKTIQTIDEFIKFTDQPSNGLSNIYRVRLTNELR